MAADNVTSIKALNDALATTLKTLNSISEEIKDISAMQNDAANTMRSSVSNRGGHKNIGSGNRITGTDGATFSGNNGSGGSMMNWLSSASSKLSPYSWSNTTLAAVGAAQGVGTAAVGVAGGVAALAPDVSSTLTRAGMYYTAAQYGSLGYTQLQTSTLNSLNGKFGAGVSPGMGDAMAATSLQRQGYMPGSTAYNAVMGEVGGAYRSLNMDNATAAQAIGGFQSGSMGANLYSIGISTIGSNGKQLSQTDIAKALYSRLMQGPGAKTQANIAQSFQQGMLGADLNSLGFSSDQQQILLKQFENIAAGKNPDLATATNAGNPLSGQQAVTSSQTNLMQAAQSSMIAGFNDAAKVIVGVNSELIKFGTTLDAISKTKGFASAMANSGAGKAGTSVLGGIWHGVKAVADTVFTMNALKTLGTAALDVVEVGAAAGGGGTSGYGGAFGINPGAVAGTNTLAGSGGKVASPITGLSPTTPYGATGSALWNSPAGNTHTGEDYAVPVGTPVHAVAAGIVFDQLLGSDYGTYVQIDHQNGYTTLYGHLSSKDVKVGDTVQANQRIGKSGQSGNVSGPHLHFEVRKGKNNPVDPAVLKTPDFVMGMVSGSQEYTQGTILGTGDQQAWAKDFLKKMGAPTTTQNVTAMTTWMAYEGGQWKNTAHYNPLNTTLAESGALDINSAGVKSYTSYSQGLDANVATLNENQKGYSAIRAALMKGSSTADVIKAVNASAWGSHIGGGSSGYGAAVPVTTASSVMSQGPTTTGAMSGGNNITINVTVAQASDEEAIRLAKKVKSYLDDRNSISIAGSK